MVKDIVQSKLSAIALEGQAVPVVLQAVSGWLKPYGVDTGQVEKDLGPIFSDHYVDVIEAPWLYASLKNAAGTDFSLNAEEAANIFSAEATSVPQKELPLLASDLGGSDLLLMHLEKTQEHVNGLIEVCEHWLRDQQTDETSYLHYVSAENLLGLSGWLHEDGRPFSDMDFRGLQNFLGWLYRIRSGLNIFQSQIQTDHHRFNSRAVQEFLASPFSSYAHLAFHFERGGNNEDEREVDTYFRFLHFVRGVVLKALNSGSERLADVLASYYEKDLGKKYEEAIYEVLPSPTFRFFDSSFTTFANSVASLDSLALMAAGGLAVKAVARTAKGALLFSKFRKLSAPVRWSIPGSNIFPAVAGENFWVGGVKMFGNFAAEAIKLTSLTTVAYAIGGETLQRAVGNVSVLVGGAVSGLASSVPARLVREVAQNRPNLLWFFLKEDAAKGEIRFLAKSLAVEGEQRSFRLARHLDVDAVSDGLRRLKVERDILTLSQSQASRTSARLQGAFQALTKLVKRNPDVLGDDILAQAEASLHLENPKEALAVLNRLLEESKQEIRRIRLASTAPAVAGKRRNPLGSSRSNGGGRGRAPRELDETLPHSEPEAVIPNRTPSLLENLVENPPAGINRPMISQLTGGKVILSKRAEKDLTQFYAEQPHYRSTFWRRLKELVQEEGGDWKKLKGQQDRYRGRVGHFRILARKEADQFTITAFDSRGSMPWSE